VGDQIWRDNPFRGGEGFLRGSIATAHPGHWRDRNVWVAQPALYRVIFTLRAKLGTVLRFYVLYYCIIILCFSYLATWLPLLNKPID